MMLDKNPELVWLVWEISCRRSQELCKYFGINLCELRSALPSQLKIFSLAIQTLVFILNAKPQVLIVESIRIAILLVLFKPLFRYFLVVDCHYSCIIPAQKIPKIIRPLYTFVHRKADLVIVTNKAHAEYIHKVGGTVFILQDKIPIPPLPPPIVEERDYQKTVCICSYNSDEPIKELFLAAQELKDRNVRFFLTGNSKGMFIEKDIPDNLYLTGYLSDEEYWNLLWDADVIIDLTTRENCLVCGAYEAVSVEKPLVLSSTSSLRGYFVKGAVFCENTGMALAQAIIHALDNHRRLTLEICEFKRSTMPQWERMADALIAHIRMADYGKAHCLIERTQRINL